MKSPSISSAAERNKQPILDVLLTLLPGQGRALEIASGTGQHVVWFGQHLPRWTWQPTDVEDRQFADIRTQVAAARLDNVRTPRLLDVLQQPWLHDDAGDESPAYELIYCANMLHIAPWACCAGLMQGTARHLAPGGCLVTYGPYLEDETPTAESNLSFDTSLRARNPAWGLRRREDVEQEARGAGLRLEARHAMPANNLLLMWRREA